MKVKYKKVIIPIFIISILYLLKEVVCLFIAAFPGMDQAPHGKEAVWLTEPLNRHQQAYFFENKKFATVEELVNDPIFKSVDNHKYSIEVKENAVFSNSMQNDARKDPYIRKNLPVLAKIFGWGHTPTYTVAGAVFYLPLEKDFKDIVCISNTPGWQELNKPYLKGNEPVCGEGTTKYR